MCACIYPYIRFFFEMFVSIEVENIDQFIFLIPYPSTN